MNKFNCYICDYHTDRRSSYDKHMISQKHIKQNITTYKYSCIDCDINTNCKRDYDRHISTQKHLMICQTKNQTINNDIVNNSSIEKQTIENKDKIIIELQSKLIDEMEQ